MHKKNSHFFIFHITNYLRATPEHQRLRRWHSAASEPSPAALADPVHFAGFYGNFERPSADFERLSRAVNPFKNNHC
jgi:hypothetical protein